MNYSKGLNQSLYLLCCILILLLSACSKTEKTDIDDNQGPVITGIPVTTVYTGAAYNFTPAASDANGDSLTFTIVGKPSWASFNEDTGELSGLPQETDVGLYPYITIRVSDETFAAPLPAFSIEVFSGALQLGAGTDQTITRQDTLQLDATATRAGESLPTGSTTYSWVKTSGPGTVVFADAGAEDTTATISARGSYQLTLTVDDSNDVVSDTVEITVNTMAAGDSGLPARPGNATECIAPGEASQVPAQLSDWGCFLADNKTFSDNVIPYDINNVLWTDNADKGRFIAIPDDTTIGVDSQGFFEFPAGSVVGKHFWLNNQIVETRLMLHHASTPAAWLGYSYEWDDDQIDAELLPGSKVRDLGNQTSWYYPSPAECMDCHTAITRFTVGPEVGQLNRLYTYPSTGTEANQLVTLETIGVMSSDFTDQQKKTAFYAIDDLDYSTERRARSYIHSNCAYCHQPGGSGGGNMDFRMSATLDGMRVCNKVPTLSFMGLPDPKIIAPGDPDNSILVKRMESLDPANRMPPLGTAEVDIDAMLVIRDWITNIAECPG